MAREVKMLHALCENCDEPLTFPDCGAVRLYCSPTCRQRAYEKRHGIARGQRRGWQPTGLRGRYRRVAS